MEAYQEAISNNDPAAIDSWYNYLNELAVLIYNIYCIFGWKIIIGGIVSPLIENDMDYLMDRIYDINVFKKVAIPDIILSRYGEFGPAVGAAMLPIDRFLDM